MTSLEKHIQDQLVRARELADIINTTVDEQKFYLSLNEITRILYELTKYENVINFTITPSQNLERIIENRNKAIDLFEKRKGKKDAVIKISDNRDYTPRYCASLNWEQDSDKSIIKNDGKYDFKNFSQHESDTIKYVLNIVNEKYPKEFYSIGLVNESYPMKYKARSVLFEIAIYLYEHSDDVIDKFAVSLAYQSKGANFRKKAIQYFEDSEDEIDAEFMSNFSSYIPLQVYTMFSKIYEQEHDYEKAILYTNKAREWSFSGNPYFDNHLEELREKQKKPHRRRTSEMSVEMIEQENDLRKSAEFFSKYFK